MVSRCLVSSSCYYRSREEVWMDCNILAIIYTALCHRCTALNRRRVRSLRLELLQDLLHKLADRLASGVGLLLKAAFCEYPRQQFQAGL